MKRQVHFNKTALAAALSLSFYAFTAQAAETYKSEDVVVTASRIEFNKTPELQPLQTSWKALFQVFG